MLGSGYLYPVGVRLGFVLVFVLKCTGLTLGVIYYYYSYCYIIYYITYIRILLFLFILYSYTILSFSYSFPFFTYNPLSFPSLSIIHSHLLQSFSSLIQIYKRNPSIFPYNNHLISFYTCRYFDILIYTPNTKEYSDPACFIGVDG